MPISKKIASKKPARKKVRKTARASAPVSSMKMMFVASHGLQTPLSAIRWGSSRLKKTNTGAFTQEQAHLIDGIAENAKTLSRMLDTMLILAKVEEGSYQANPQKIYLQDFLASFTQKFELPKDFAVDLRASDDDILLMVDRGILETIVQALMIAVVSSAQPSTRIAVHCMEDAGTIRIEMHCPLQLSLLSSVRAGTDDQQLHQLVGGPTGLMLSIAHSLAHCLAGSVELIDRGDGEYVVVLGLRS